MMQLIATLRIFALKAKFTNNYITITHYII